MRPTSRATARSASTGTSSDPRTRHLDRWFWLAGPLWLGSIAAAVWAGTIDPSILTMIAFTTVGALVAWLRPTNPVGWLLLADGLVWTVGGVVYRLGHAEPRPPGLVMADAFFDTAGWVVGLGLVPLALLVFPSGRSPGRRWRLVGWMIVGGGLVLGLANLVTPGPLPSTPGLRNPFGVETAEAWAPVVAHAAEWVFFLGFLGAIVSVFVRYQRSSGLERQQLRWLAVASGLIVVGYAIGNVVQALGLPGAWAFYTLPSLAVPAAVGIALLRYRLWDLDLMLGRTLTYGLLALLVAAVYVLVVAGVGALVGAGTSGEVWLAVLATAIAAALFQPAREAVQAGVRRLLFTAPIDPESVPVSIRTMGGFRLERAGRPVTASEWKSKKARQLLKMLIARRGRPVNREQLIDALWPDATGGNLANRLAVAASTIRAVFDPDKAFPSDHFIAGDAESLRLVLDHVWIDVERFLEVAEIGLRTLGPDLEEAERLYRGDFLEEEPYDDWAFPLREEARATYLSVLRARAEGEQTVDRAVAAHMRILEVDPWDEQAHLAVVSALRAAGRHGEAQRAYRRYRARMEELGVAPSSV